MNKKLLESFKKIYEQEENLKTYKAYYLALCNWLKDNRSGVNSSFYSERINMLLSLDPDEYDINEDKGNGISLTNEKKRIGDGNFSRIEGLFAAIEETLWDMVTLSSDKECSNCHYGDLRYIKINPKSTNSRIILECSDCGRAMDLEGNMIDEKIDDYRPAMQKEL